MDELYGEQHRLLQQEFDTTKLADRVKEFIVSAEITDEHKPFIESRDMFFLSSIDHRGYPTCSHKGGEPGFIKVVNEKTIAFPSYDGNGMFLSLGNINASNKVGMLFIDFETPHRIRVHGTANIDRQDPLIKEFHGAELVVRIKVTEIFVNCPRYINKYQRVQSSKYTPKADFEKPLTPKWKLIDGLQDVLPEKEKGMAEKLGGTITPEEYGELLGKGKG
ncbi:MAG: pyridoxamine 5'-phosphate oxidase family protein [Methylococcales symbiont of Hymedesmia sp. n. MRB-2018]|nr:MAG: pyridoxamine 5'-phosphate oxidase family protein [Methylococcales symbiont of Hymedesmia sp. n. MRB-2018]KAF3984391.1 MAG: pyridoxamine 5'-phosphate oxidase family protein [Methylococcales symbiont of Hymedesmia sp. n. MRB-2018]SMN02043.1 Pyridoxamine 5'-phosphate oxidase [uncultured Candidatus Thioglobus sp.]